MTYVLVGSNFNDFMVLGRNSMAHAINIHILNELKFQKKTTIHGVNFSRNWANYDLNIHLYQMNELFLSFRKSKIMKSTKN